VPGWRTGGRHPDRRTRHRRPARHAGRSPSTARPCASGHHPNGQVHLLAVTDHPTPAVLAQADVDPTTNEVARFRPLLDRLDLTDTVATADALHPQREPADWLVTHKHAAHVLVAMANQPTLHQQLRRLPRREVPATDHPATAARAASSSAACRWPPSLAWSSPRHPGAAPHPPGPSLRSRRWRTVAVCGHQPDRRGRPPRPLGRLDPGAQGIEALYHLRNTTFAEDACRVRTGTAPRAMASLRCSASPAHQPDMPARCRDPDEGGTGGGKPYPPAPEGTGVPGRRQTRPTRQAEG